MIAFPVDQVLSAASSPYEPGICGGLAEPAAHPPRAKILIGDGFSENQNRPAIECEGL